MTNLHKIYVYGTLRPGDLPTVLVPGHLYDLGWYPGAVITAPDATDSRIVCEVIEVTDKRLAELDHYEGYSENDPVGSLYIRKPYLSGWIYEYNQPLSGRQIIETGDWFKRTHEVESRICA